MTKTRKTTITVSEAEFRSHANAFDGLCLACGSWTTGGVEPDASGYPCEGCEAHRVMGAEEALLMGHLDVT